jgi:hypothetical protein
MLPGPGAEVEQQALVTRSTCNTSVSRRLTVPCILRIVPP